jgi:hypothetical protein
MENNESVKIDHLLLDMFCKKMFDELKGKALAAIEPSIDDAVKKAILEMHPEIQKEMDLRRNGLMIALITHREKSP